MIKLTQGRKQKKKKITLSPCTIKMCVCFISPSFSYPLHLNTPTSLYQAHPSQLNTGKHNKPHPFAYYKMCVCVRSPSTPFPLHLDTPTSLYQAHRSRFNTRKQNRPHSFRPLQDVRVCTGSPSTPFPLHLNPQASLNWARCHLSQLNTQDNKHHPSASNYKTFIRV